MTISPIGSVFGYGSFNRSWPLYSREQFGGGTASSIFANRLNLHRGLVMSGLDGLFSALGTNLNLANAQQDALDQIKASLTRLRSILQSTRDQVAANPGRVDLRALTRDIEQTVEQVTYTSQDVYETRPVYEQREIRATDVYGTRSLTSYSSFGGAGIDNSANLSIQVGSGSVATVQFKNSTKITVTVDGATQTFSFGANDGTWRTGLVNALNSIANLSAEIAADGTLHLQTANAESLTIADVPNGLLDLSGNPLPSLGLPEGTTESTVVGYEEVQVGTEEVKVGTEQIATGTTQVSLGARSIVVGFERVQGAGAADADKLRTSVRDLVAAASLLVSASAASTTSTAPRNGGAQGFAADLIALLTNSDFNALADASDALVFDRVIGRIDDALAKAEDVGKQIAAHAADLAAASQASLVAMLTNFGVPASIADPIDLARQTANGLRATPFGIIRSHQLSVWS
jgi:hypothetical protein